MEHRAKKPIANAHLAFASLMLAMFAFPAPAHPTASEDPAPSSVTVKKDTRVKVSLSGKKSGEITLLKGEILDVIAPTRSGFVVRKGGFDPVELKRYEVERVRKVEKIAPSPSPPSGFSVNYSTPKPKLSQVKDFGAMVEDAWSENGVRKKMFAWPGREVVFMTSEEGLDPQVMQKLVDCLDVGWRFYKKITVMSPSQTELSRKFGGRGVFVAVPDYRFVSNNAALGYVGAIGVEVALFYKNQFGGKSDYLKLKEDGVLPDYYFYEMGRNYYLFGESHRIFATGFAVAMSILCLDQVSAETGISSHPRSQAARDVERSFFESGASWGTAFGELGAPSPISLKDSEGKPLPSNMSDLYASMVLYMHKNFGGDEWLKSYCSLIASSPPSPRSIEGGSEGQMLTMVIAASLAARQNLSDLFRNRWRMPLSPAIFDSLGSIDWSTGDIESCLAKMPLEDLPVTLACTRPEFLEKARSGEEVILDPSAETPGKRAWKSIRTGLPLAPSNLERKDRKDGKSCISVEGTPNRDGWRQSVVLEKGKIYALSAWVKVEGIVPMENSNGQGAFVSVGPRFRSALAKGNSGWRHVGFAVVAEDGNPVDAELVVENSVGRAYFDSVHLSEIAPRRAHRPASENLAASMPPAPGK